MHRRWGGAAGQLRLAQGQHITLAQSTAAVSAELSQHESGFAAQVIGHVDTITYGDVGAAAAGHLAGDQGLAGTDPYRLPQRDGFPVQGGVTGGAGEGDNRFAMEVQGRADQRGFQAGGAVVVADDAVGQTERVIIHRAGGRNADIPVAGTARIVLHRGIGPRFLYLEYSGTIFEGLQITSGDAACRHVRVDQNLPQVIQVGGNAAEAGFRQGGLHFP